MNSNRFNTYYLKLFLFVLILIFSIQCSSNKLPKVEIQTQVGSILLEIDTVKAPVTSVNFLKYVDEKRYHNSSFYRVVTMDNQPNNQIKIEVIQGGLEFNERQQSFEPIKHETTKLTSLLHTDGVISMARNEPGTASSEFFICVGNQPDLDFGGKRNPDGQGFASFGKVINGFDIVKVIHGKPEDDQMLVTPIEIIKIVRVKE